MIKKTEEELKSEHPSSTTVSETTDETQEVHEPHESEEEKAKSISFADHLWGSIDAIKENIRKGGNILDGVITFGKSFHKAYENYALAISKAIDVFEKDMLKYNSLDTTTICMSSFWSEMKNMIEDMRNKCEQFDEILYNPSVMFSKHYIEQNRRYLDEAKKYLTEIDYAKKSTEKAKKKYDK